MSDFSSTDDTLAGMDATEDTYDRQAETSTTTDANFTTHTITYNGLGAELTDTVTVPDGNPANIDLTVTEIAMAYKACGRLQYVTSLNAADDVVNQLYFVYDTNGNLEDEYEEYGGAVDTATSEYVAFGYDDSTGTGYEEALGTSVTIAAAGFRPTTLQYPTTGTDSSRVITDSYGTSGGMDDEINQLEAVVDGSGTADDPTVGDTLDTMAAGRWDDRLETVQSARCRLQPARHEPRRGRRQSGPVQPHSELDLGELRDEHDGGRQLSISGTCKATSR